VQDVQDVTHDVRAGCFGRQQIAANRIMPGGDECIAHGARRLAPDDNSHAAPNV